MWPTVWVAHGVGGGCVGHDPAPAQTYGGSVSWLHASDGSTTGLPSFYEGPCCVQLHSMFVCDRMVVCVCLVCYSMCVLCVCFVCLCVSVRYLFLTTLTRSLCLCVVSVCDRSYVRVRVQCGE